MRTSMKNKDLKKYIIICDESTKKGKNFSYFYGGAMIDESKYQKISDILNDYKEKFGFNELKRVKITKANYKQYIEVMDLFFTFVKSGAIKLRIMFSPNDQLLKNIKHSEDESFMKFYYAFIINAFNIFYAGKNFRLRLIFDDLPETKEQCNKFKELLMKKIVTNEKQNTNKVYLKKEDIEEVDSKKHVILQCVDVVVGLIDFILNTPSAEINKSSRAKARYQVWQEIYKHILEINSEFQLKETTKPVYSNIAWKSNYRHFVYHQKNKR